MSSPRLDDDSFSVDCSLELLSAFDFGGFELPGGRCSVSDLMKMNTMMPPFRSLSRVTWGCAIKINVAARHVVSTASFAKRVSKSPVGTVNFYDRGSPAN